MASPSDIKEIDVMYMTGITEMMAVTIRIRYRPYAFVALDPDAITILQILGDD